MSSDPGACITMLPENALDSLNDQLHTSINDCLDVLLNQDRSLKDLTLRALQLVEDVKAKVGEANALFTDGVRLFNRPSNPFNYFSEAEDKGCTHSALYYFMGECYRDGDMGVKGDASMAIEYYTKAIAGGCNWGHQGIHNVYYGILSIYDKSLRYILDVEMEGNIDGCVHHEIGLCYHYGIGCDADASLALKYYQRSIDLGYQPSHMYLYWLIDEIHAEPFFAIIPPLTPFGALQCGVGINDDVIVRWFFDNIERVVYRDGSSCSDDIGTNNKSISELVLHYCDVWIQKEVPQGYFKKGRLYMKGGYKTPIDQAKAVSIWEEADKVGLADYETYTELCLAYWHGYGVPVDGTKVIEYGEKALKIVRTEEDIMDTLSRMADVYTGGLQPITKDDTKALECYERALEMTSLTDSKAELYKKINDLRQGTLPPLPPTGTETK